MGGGGRKGVPVLKAQSIGPLCCILIITLVPHLHSKASKQSFLQVHIPQALGDICMSVAVAT